MNPVDKQFVDILNKTIALREKQNEENNNEDEDKLFCLSLYKELKKVPDHARIRTKIQILEVLQRAQDFYNPYNMHTEGQGYNQHQPQSYEFNIGANRQYNLQRPPVQEGFSGNFGYSTSTSSFNQTSNHQPATSANVHPSSAVSPTDSINSQSSTTISDIYN